MDTHSDPDGLSDLERRLSAWEPTSAGLSAADMLFAAGRAAAQPGRARFVWPALACGMTVLAVGLGVWLTVERSERLVLAQRLREAPVPQRSAPPTPSPGVPSEPGTAEGAPYSFLGSRRALESGLEAWQARDGGAEPPSQSLPEQPVLQVGQRGALLDP